MTPRATPVACSAACLRSFVAAMLAVEEADGPPGWLAIALAVLAVHLCLWLAMRFSSVIHRVLGDGGTTLVTRLAGLLLAAIATQLMADAVFAFIDAHS